MAAVVVLGCSATSSGELILAREWAVRAGRAGDLVALVPAPLVTLAAGLGTAVGTFPHDRGIDAARAAVLDEVGRIGPELVVVADLLNLCGFSATFGRGLLPLLDQLERACPVVALDLYDYDRRRREVDICGSVVCGLPAPPPARLGRLMPSPYLAPAGAEPGRGRYGLMAAPEPVSRAARATARRSLGVGEAPLVVLITSAWQHIASPPMMAVKDHFPVLALRLLDLAAERVGRVRVGHLGPQPLEVPAAVARLDYRHHDPRPDDYHRLLQAADLLLAFSPLASSAVRAALVGVPVASMVVGGRREPTSADPATSAAESAVQDYLSAVDGGYAMSVWPAGMYLFVESLRAGNPWSATQRQVDVLRADEAVGRLGELLAPGPARDELRAAQLAYRDMIEERLPSAEDALAAALAG